MFNVVNFYKIPNSVSGIDTKLKTNFSFEYENKILYAIKKGKK